MENEIEILYRLQKRDVKALKRLCYDYAENMVIQAYGFLRDSNKANGVVDDVLLRIWRELDFLALTEPLHTYLYGQVKRACEQIA
jgi:DNA-directed RNA polymerase specialized sigma24 family protein